MTATDSQCSMRFRLLLALLLSQLTMSPAALALGWWGMTLTGAPCIGAGEGAEPWDWFDVRDAASPHWQEGRVWEMRVVHLDKGRNEMAAEPLNEIDYRRAAQEFDFILRAVPNWPEALKAVIDLDEKKRRANERGGRPWTPSTPPPECYLQRAIVFRPKQSHVHQLFGIYLQQLKHLDEAVMQYSEAVKLEPTNAEIHYNLGLVYFDLGDFGAAEEHARRAYELGYPLPGLKRKLEKIGKWEPR